jgi:hypothetical protein
MLLCSLFLEDVNYGVMSFTIHVCMYGTRDVDGALENQFHIRRTGFFGESV